MAAIKADQVTLNSLGYDPQLCLVDLGETAETVVTQKLTETDFDCVMIGAGFALFQINFFYSRN